MTVSHRFENLSPTGGFESRHIGPSPADRQKMLQTLGFEDMDAFLATVLPASIRSERDPDLPAPLGEEEALAALEAVVAENRVQRSFIGQGYYGTWMPAVIQRNLFENPAWYTAYTPYQPELAQGRLEALLNFQTMVADLTGMDLANASLLDEASAAAEAMALCRRVCRKKVNAFFVDEQCFPQTIDVLRTRAEPLGIELVVGDPERDLDPSAVFGALFQYPGADGELRDYSDLCEALHEAGAKAAFAADLLALVLLKSPGAMGADVVVGSSQRFGVPMGAGGPHAAYMATREAYKRSLPGRLVGVSEDADGRPAFRLALQTREQHIRREKATSNICTAQVLLAVIAGMYAVYHGPEGLRRIALRVQGLTSRLAAALEALGYARRNRHWFDTLVVHTGEATAAIHAAAERAGFNLRRVDGEHLGISLDETTSVDDVEVLISLFGDPAAAAERELAAPPATARGIPAQLEREDPVLTHEVFHAYRSETDMLRYLRRLADRDMALDRAMIPLGSCTMKLNASAEMLPVSWPALADLHPLAPAEQLRGYADLVAELEHMLCEVTGYDAVSLQPNAGSQGEFAGLLAIRAYHRSRGEEERDVCLIPSSAHGTNPASAQLCGMRVVLVECDEAGNVDLEDVRRKAEQHAGRIAAIMVTYPSTHGVFEEHICELAEIVHAHGGQMYIDGANLNALVGLSRPGDFGGDVSHLNLHKTFCIPHGGGGPGVGPVAARAHLAPFLPGHRHGAEDRRGAPVSAAPWGSASILPISWMYLRMMGADGLKRATQTAILSANYVAARLSEHYPVLYTGSSRRVAHECIIDLRGLQEQSGISVEDVAKRLVDYGFHAPTMSFPVAGTLMVEPTESESLAELDRFCDAMAGIRAEIQAVIDGALPAGDNPLVNAPHTAEMLLAETWDHPYTRRAAAYPLAGQQTAKYWPPVRRVDNVLGDRNLQCACPPLDSYR